MKLKGEEFETLEELQERVEELLGLINSELMERVYEHWIERLIVLEKSKRNLII
jgi:hypothetical protein